MPKRKFAECASDGPVSGESEDSNCSSVQTDGSTDVAAKSEKGSFNHVRKKSKKSVSFDAVTVYYFPRKQGFTCVPSQGGSTLGMSEKHHGVETFSLTEYTSVQRRIHHQILLDQHQQGKIILPPDKLILYQEPPEQNGSSSPSASSSPLPGEPSNGSEVNSEEEEDEFSIDDYYFLQPVPTRQRRVLLRQSGIKKIEPVEKDECKDIRSSREVCGCDCKVFCDPDTCICSKAGIKCQVDRLSFPCGCSKDGCGNLHGRIEFNPIRVRTHFIHTLMRIEMEKKRLVNPGCKGGGILKSKKTAACQVKQKTNITCEGGASSQCTNPSCPPESNSTTDKDCVPCVVNTGGDSQGKEVADARSEPSSKPAEEEDLSIYNSNERGSCRDCQKSDISTLIESQFTTQSAELDSCMGTSNRSFSLAEEAQIGLPTVTNPSESLPQLMMFSDDEEQYNAENTTAMFQFPKEESSYSESSDCSSEGAGSVDEQPAYHNYHNFSTYEVGPDGQPNHANRAPVPRQDGTTSSNMTVPPEQVQGCVYRQGTPGPSATQTEQEYINLNSPTNGYKLEPISEILNPIRYPGYPAGPVPAADPGLAWGSESYCSYATKNGGKNANKSQQPTAERQGESSVCSITNPFSQTNTPQDMMTGQMNGVGSASSSPTSHYPYQASHHCQNDKSLSQVNNKASLDLRNHSNHTDVSTATTVSDIPFRCSANQYAGSDSMYNGGTGTTSSCHSKSEHTDAKPTNNADTDGDKPKYHELKSSSQPAAKSLASSYFSANQVTASFDLANQNTPSTVPSFHLSNDHNSRPSCTTEIATTGTADLYSLPRAQTAQPVATFDLPNTTEDQETDITPGAHESRQSSSPSRDQPGVTPTQNFGEIIKESIVETVSA